MSGLQVANFRGSLRQWWHSEYAGAAIVGLACLLKGWTYLPYLVDDGGVPAVERWVPMNLAAVMWITVGLVGVVCSVSRRWLGFAIGAGAALHVLWGSLYFTGWLTGHSSRGYVTAILYFAFVALLLWAYSRRVDVTVHVDRTE